MEPDLLIHEARERWQEVTEEWYDEAWDEFEEVDPDELDMLKDLIDDLRETWWKDVVEPADLGGEVVAPYDAYYLRSVRDGLAITRAVDEHAPWFDVPDEPDEVTEWMLPLAAWTHDVWAESDTEGREHEAEWDDAFFVFQRIAWILDMPEEVDNDTVTDIRVALDTLLESAHGW